MTLGNSFRSTRLLLLALAAFAALAGPSLRARDVQIVPEWSVQVLDETGRPVAGFEVAENWEFYGLSSHRGDEIRKTDILGRVVFPARSFTVSAAAFAAGRALSLLNVHASFGPSGAIRIAPRGFKPGESYYATDEIIYDRAGAKTTKDTKGFTTVFQFLSLDYFDFLRKPDWATTGHILATDPATAGLRDGQGATPLIVLSTSDFAGRNAEMIKLLLAAGADINAQAKDGTTALHNAAKGYQTAYMDLLLSKGADPKLKIHDSPYYTTNGFTPLHFLLSAYGNHIGPVSAAEKIKGIDLLLAHGADISARDSTGASPLHLAARWGDPEIVEALLARGADAEARNAAGLTPLASIGEVNKTAPVQRIRELLLNAVAKKATR